MGYYFGKEIDTGFEEAKKKVIDALAQEGFGILSDIDIRSKFKQKMDLNFRPYVILGACNPPFAYKALQAEDKIGTMLPCSVIVQEKGRNLIEVAIINPKASMTAVENPVLEEIAAHQGIISRAADVPIIVSAMKAEVDYLATFNRRHFIDDPTVAASSDLRIGTPGDALNWFRKRKLE